MITDDKSKVELSNLTEKWLSINSLDTKDKEFEKWFDLDENNFTVKYDSIILIDRNFISSFDNNGSYLSGIPLYSIISFEDINSEDTKFVRFDISIPYELDTNITKELEYSQSFALFYLESESNLFVSNSIKESVDNSYSAVKQLFDAKFNLLRQENYERLPIVLSEILSKNAIKGFQSIIYELMVMSLSRELNDPSKEFRFTAKDNTPHDKFQMINIRDISRNTSAFSAIASENISKGLMVALSQSKKEKSNEIITPHEQIALKKY